MKNDGGYMFPRPMPTTPVAPDEALELIKRYSGCTRRDWYAGMAMRGIISNPGLIDELKLDGAGGWISPRAFALADSMLAEGDKPMTEEPNSEYGPLTWEPVRMSLIVDAKGETDQERMRHAEQILRKVLDRPLPERIYTFDEIEAVEVVRDDEPTEAARIRAACVRVIRELEQTPPHTILSREQAAINLRSAIGWPRKQEETNATA